MEWIDLKVAQPSESDDYLTLDKEGKILKLRFERFFNCFTQEKDNGFTYFPGNITHWKPLKRNK